MTDAELADEIERNGINGRDDFSIKVKDQIIAALRRPPSSVPYHIAKALNEALCRFTNQEQPYKEADAAIKTFHEWENRLSNVEPSSDKVLVPREPTRTMILAGKEHEQGRNVVAIYHAMLAAAEAEEGK